uniref:Lung seven transmembrane receptor family protein n=1 Tax=Syphacia muris TaxID=451379 RepID=A0A0N5AB04_9BILA
MRSKSYICQLGQVNEGYDAVFLHYNFTHNFFNISKTGALRNLHLCPDLFSCLILSNDSTRTDLDISKKQYFRTADDLDLKKIKTNSGEIAYEYASVLKPTTAEGLFTIAIHFDEILTGKYYLLFHNCFNYGERFYGNIVPVSFTIDITEKNVNSFLSAGDIAKPNFYFCMSGVFAFVAVLWIYNICQSSSAVVYRIHHLMTALVIIKSLSLLFHGINYYFVSLYGHQQEMWAVVYYITHLLKGALLFGTIILIGTGYTLFKNFLSDRDRKLVMVVLPLQVIDNIAMIIIDESEFAEQNYQFWFQIFIFIDIICCMAIILPIVWYVSMRHLQEGARSDGKAAFNLEKLILFRHFYLIVISYIYLTRVIRFFVEYVAPFDYEWISDGVVEVSTLLFFLITGHKFRPQERNPYLKLSQEVEGEALTQSGVFESVTRVKRIQPRDDICDSIPGSIGGTGGYDSDDSDAEDIFPQIEKQPLTRSTTVL